MISFEEKQHHLYAKVQFKDFNEALKFINQIGDLAEKLQHHPTIHNTYNVVELYLNTHDAGDIITEKDWELAREISKLY